MVDCARKTLALEENAKLLDRLSLEQADVAQLPSEAAPENYFDWVIINPPFNDASDRQTPHQVKSGAHVMEDGLFEVWLRKAATVLHAKGSFALIARPQSLSDILEAADRRFGALQLTPVYPRVGEDTIRILVRGTKGSFDQADVVDSASTPISDTLKIGASGARLSRGGFGENIITGEENYNKDIWAARGTLEFDSGPVFIRLSGDYTKDNSNARQGARLIPGLLTGAPVLDSVFDTRAGLDVVDQEVDAYGGALNIAIELSDTLTLKSITGYREDKSTTPIDFDSLPSGDLDVPAIYENDQFSQELQLL